MGSPVVVRRYQALTHKDETHCGDCRCLIEVAETVVILDGNRAVCEYCYERLTQDERPG